MIFSKVRRFKVLYYELVQFFKIEIHLKGSLEIIELLCFSLFCAHLIACLWYLSAVISLNEQSSMSTWLANVTKNSTIIMENTIPIFIILGGGCHDDCGLW